MPRNELGDIRRSQIITTHGPGAILDFRAGNSGAAAISVISAGLEVWDQRAAPPGLANPQTIYEPRLQKQLGIDGFRLPPVAPQIAPGQYARSAGTLAGVRFPTWLTCPQCHLLRQAKKWTSAPGDAGLYCESCSGSSARSRVYVVPVRFIVMCPYGHLDEFPWHRWVEHRDGCSARRELMLRGSATAGLAGYILSCTECDARRSMEGIFGDGAVVTSCSGRRPWLPTEPEKCPGGQDDPPRVVQRGASNIYFSVVESALDIPPWSDALQSRLGVYWGMLVNAPNDDFLGMVIDQLKLPALTRMTKEKLITEIKARIVRMRAPQQNLRWEEYEQLTKHQTDFSTREFEVRPIPSPDELSPWIDRVVKVTRLREVRALRGFTRVLPPSGPNDPRIAPIYVNPPNWLPAVENRGEGIFLRLAPERLSDWESQPQVAARAATLSKAYADEWARRGGVGTPPRTITARFLLLHSFAHALIRQLSLDCGYNSASLRERLYADVGTFDMAGVLIFTASPDADGTLGGLVRQGDPEMLARVADQALRSMMWCSSDPLCIEGVHALTDTLSGAACHCCLLGSETSCEEFNRLLDRALLVGTPRDPGIGYFSAYLSGED